MVDSDRPQLRKGWLSTRLAPRQVIDAERSEQDSPGLRDRLQRSEQARRHTGQRPAADPAAQPAPRPENAQARRVADAVSESRDVFGPPDDDIIDDTPPADDGVSRGAQANADDAFEDEALGDDAPHIEERQPEEPQARAEQEPPQPDAVSVRAAPSVNQRRRQAAERAANQIGRGGQPRASEAPGAAAPAVFGEAMSVVQAEFRPARDLVVVHQPESVRARAYRRLHAQLMARMQDQPETPAVAAVSPNAGEGRSSLAGNLAVLFARAGVPVLLIDADLRKGGQERLFGCRAETGLSDWLRGEQALTGLWFEELPGLVLVPAGRYDTGAAERLTHPGFRQWIARQGKADQVVIIDTAAGSEAEETQAVCAAAGGALLVCRRHRTPLSEVRSFIDALESQRVQFYGAALLD